MARRTLGWNRAITQRDSAIIFEIAKRAARELPYGKVTVAMDLEVVHERTPLDLERFLNADFADFVHDIVGIYRHIDRPTGNLGGCFSPRFLKRKEVSQ